MLKRLAALLAFIPLLTGCNVWKQITGIGNTSTPRSHVILVMGQSNNVRFQQYGETAFTKDIGGQVTFINCSVGGTQISQWQADGALVEACDTSTVKPTAILFFQGESDAVFGLTDWAQQFTSAVRGWRRLYGNIPIVYAQLAVEDPQVWASASSWNSIKHQQMEVRMPHVVMIKTDDIAQLDSDKAVAGGVHLSQGSFVKIAERYAQALAGIE